MRRGRPPSATKTRLGAAIRARRGATGQLEAAQAIGIPRATLAGIERGTAPSAATARALARWLGWTTDQVLDAAEPSA